MSNDSMLDIYLFENEQLLEKLESDLLSCDKKGEFSSDDINDIFRILHTIKGSSGMMNFEDVANLSHAVEDLFAFLREHDAKKSDFKKIINICFETLDVINAEMQKIQENGLPDGNSDDLIARVRDLHKVLTGEKSSLEPKAKTSKAKTTKKTAAKKTAAAKKTETVKEMAAEESEETKKEVTAADLEGYGYKAILNFKEGCKMENVRALGAVKSIESMCSHVLTQPRDLNDDSSAEIIILNGFEIYMLSKASKNDLLNVLKKTFFVESLDFEELSKSEVASIFGTGKSEDKAIQKSKTKKSGHEAAAVKHTFMSVNLDKLDLLMEIVGEIVITEATVTKNPDVVDLHLDRFEKASRQLNKLTKELQDIVMSIRMVPVSTTFRKMERIVRDMAEKMDKKATLTVIGEETELDKNILDQLSDPLMHLIRNSMDHGIEPTADRKKAGKDLEGQVVLEARNTGSEILIMLSDDGRGLDKEKLIKKGIEKGLIKKQASEVSDSEAYGLIFAPGFSTKTQVSEFSGRGVGMDVVTKNIEKMGGSVSLDSTPGQGMTIQIRIPPTLAIIDGMLVSVGKEIFIVPILPIKESFKPKKDDIFLDTEGNENILLRGQCYPIVRLHSLFNIETEVTDLEDGILVIVQSDSSPYCLFVDELVGEQQAVIKPIPPYISKTLGRLKHISGCTILGDGSVSLILDIN